jgi:RNase P/RNase MRP subunit p29
MQGAIAEFERVSRALMAVLAERNASDDEVRGLVVAEERGLVVAEERARETVVLARMRLINLWRETGLEHSDIPGATLASITRQ